MKRAFSLVLALLLTLCLCACGEKDTPETATTEPTAQATTCSHSYADATCTGCGQTNEGFRELVGNFEWSYVEGKAGDEEIVLRFYGFFKEGNQIMVNVANERYATLAALAADREMTVEEIRAEYEELEMIRTYFGTEYGYNGWGVSFDEITFVEDGNTVTLTAVTESWDADDNLQRTEKTSVWTRTGLAEYTVTGGDYIPVGSVLTPAS